MSAKAAKEKSENADANRPEEGSPTKGKKRSYEDSEKELIAAADSQGGTNLRHKVAKLIGMPFATADNLMKSVKKHGREAIHDHRHDRRAKQATSAGGKQTPELLEAVLEWIHLEAQLTNQEMRELVNLEVFRKILIDSDPKELGFKLTKAEKASHAEVKQEHIKEGFKLAAVAESFDQHSIHSDATVKHWLNGVVHSRKHLMGDEGVNDAAHQAVRLGFAKELKIAMYDPQAYCLFVDELPLWLKMDHPPGRSADVEIHEHTHVYTMVSPSDGIVASSAVATSHEHLPDPHKGLKGHQRIEGFEKFLNTALGKVMASTTLDRRDVYVVANVPAEWVASVNEHKLIKSVPQWELLTAELAKTGNSCYLIKLPEYSPTLNLAEFYDRSLRDACNRFLQELCGDEAAHEEFLKHSGVGKHHLLQKIVQHVLAKAEQDPVRSSSTLRLGQAIDKCITKKGHVDFQSLYRFLFH